MIDFGTSNDNAGSLDWPSGLTLPTSGDFSGAWFAYHDDTSTGTWGTIFTVDAQYLIFRYSAGSSYKSRLLYWHGAGYINETAAAAVTADTTVRSYVWTLDDTGEDANYYVEGSLQAAPTRSGPGNYAAAGGAYAEINDYSAGSDGASGARGQMCLWNKELTSTEVTEYHTGGSMPALANLKFWCRMITTTTLDEISGAAPTTVNGSPTTEALYPDGYFQSGDYMTWALYDIFMPFMVGAAGLFGSNLMFEASKVAKKLNARCGFDWTMAELHKLTEQFRTRPAYCFMGA